MLYSMSQKQIKKSKPFSPELDTRITSLNIAAPVYVAIKTSKESLEMAEISREAQFDYKTERLVKDVRESIVTLLKNETKKRNIKYVAAKLWGEHNNLRELIPTLWLQEDIVPYVSKEKVPDDFSPSTAVNEVTSFFNDQNIAHVHVDSTNEVEIAELTSLKEYESTCSPLDFNILKKLAKEFQGKKIVFINATPQGGGVALMRHALIRLYKLLGVDAHWYVLIPKQEAFNVTKLKVHNVLQAVAPKGVELTRQDEEIYNTWTAENAKAFHNVFTSADVVVIDDPQPAGLIPYIKKVNSRAKLMYRSHIQIVGALATTKGTAQNKTWNFIWKNIKESDVFVSHPMREFIPSDVPQDKIVYMPATTDPLDGLNKPLSEAQMAYYLKIFNKLLMLQGGQMPLDPHKPYIVQIARFDPAKGIPDVIESYRLLRGMLERDKKVIPQLVIAGNAAIDDPEGIPIFNETMKLLQTQKYRHLAKDVKVARLPHMDQLLNTLLRKSKIVLQLSIKEGFEIKVTEGLMKGKPVIAYRTGGIPLQIEEGVDGYLVEAGDTQQVADNMYELLTDLKLYERMVEAALRYANKDYLTVTNALCWLFLAVKLLRKEDIGGHYAWVRDLAHLEYGHGEHKKLFGVISSLRSNLLYKKE